MIFVEQIPPLGTFLGIVGTSGLSKVKHLVQPYLFRLRCPITFGLLSSQGA